MICFYITNREREKSPIKMEIYFKGKHYSKYIGESVETAMWNTKKQISRVTASYPEGSLINAQVEKWRTAATETIEHFKERMSAPSSSEFKEELEKRRFKDGYRTPSSIVEYFSTFISRYEKTRSPGRVKHYKLAQGILSDYQSAKKTTITFEDINQDFYNKFTEWFYEKGHSANYLGETIKVLKLVVNEAMIVDKLHSNIDFKSRGFSAPSSQVDSIYLTEEELLKIHNLTIDETFIKESFEGIDIWQTQRKVKAYNKARDMFLIGAFTGLRVSDYSRLLPENITDKVRIQAKKTGIKSVIPIHWVVQEIIDRGYDFSTTMTDQKLNKHIKEVARLACITEEVTYTKNVGGKPVQLSSPKYELISSHTARRSFATNAYKAGIPTVSIMKITGHKKESTFLKYIKISEEENAEMLMSHSFFTRPNAEGNAEVKYNDET